MPNGFYPDDYYPGYYPYGGEFQGPVYPYMGYEYDDGHHSRKHRKHKHRKDRKHRHDEYYGPPPYPPYGPPPYQELEKSDNRENYGATPSNARNPYQGYNPQSWDDIYNQGPLSPMSILSKAEPLIEIFKIIAPQIMGKK